MATSPMKQVLHHLRRAALLQDEVGLTDGQLLGYFLEQRDESTFAALVRRHGPMVWGICRRVLQNHHDAEDAFQATFLVLVRKAASVEPREMVGHWLYGVARQTALNAQVATGRRKAREKQVTALPEPAVRDPDCPRDLESVLDRELSRLPEKYRVAIVLCALEGKTRKEVARQLGVPDGTIAARLARGRAMLAKRLARHGLGVAGVAPPAVLSLKAASVPAPVVSSTIRVATKVMTGSAAAGGVASTNVIALTEGVLKAMLISKIKTMMGLLLLGAIVAGTAATVGVAADAWTTRSEAARSSTPNTDSKSRVLANQAAGQAQPERPAGNQEPTRELAVESQRLPPSTPGSEQSLNEMLRTILERLDKIEKRLAQVEGTGAPREMGRPAGAGKESPQPRYPRADEKPTDLPLHGPQNRARPEVGRGKGASGDTGRPPLDGPQNRARPTLEQKLDILLERLARIERRLDEKESRSSRPDLRKQ
jgi:RNA polymerase sigma factor (sigma-70 family)